MKKRLWKRALCCAVSAAMVLSATAVSAFAYIDRGDVKIEGDSSYTLQVGETVELSVSPYAEEHYPGCQMPECPEICGEKNCIEYVNGQQECVCNGKEMQLFEAVVTVDSSDSGVAETSYDGNGSITITAKSAGDAEITITAALREYNTAEETVSVTVQDDSGEQPGGGDDKDPGDDSGNGGSGNNGGSSGGGDSSETEQYTVIFESNGGSVVEKQTVADGQKVSRPEDPTKEGFVFEGWYTDSGMTTAYDFGSEVTESFTLYAKWAEKDADPVPEISFQDVPS
ncbi:MAG: InlB B-repeat-containing protein, partial [Anaerovoracaceae bacterium]